LAFASFLISGQALAKNNQAEFKVIRAGFADIDRDVRLASCEAAGAISGKEFSSELSGALSDQVDQVKIRAAVVLYKAGDASGIPVIRKILTSAVKLSDNPTPLERARAIARGTIKVEAARALGDIKDTSSVSLLKSMTEDMDGRVSDACLVSLAKLGDSSAKDQFVSALESTKQEVRAKAAEALGDIGDTVTIPALRKRLKDWNRDAKNAAAIALGKMKDKESEPLIKEMLWDKDEIVREKAATALGYMGEESSLEALKKVMEDTNGFVRIAAAEALHKLGDDSGREFLLRVLKSEDRDAKLRALDVLSVTASAKEVPQMQKLAENKDKVLAIKASKAVIMASKRK